MLEAHKLFANCARLVVIVEDLSANARVIGLRKSDIQRTVESLLRAVDLHTEGRPGQFLYIRVAVVGDVFMASVDYDRWLSDTGHGRVGSVTVWGIDILDVHGRDAVYVIGTLADITDAFLEKYLGANARACEVRE
ncbi:MAG: hypothetical protein F4Y86_10290 [Gammaproteobacteria bacterium]|nr:hypothetical protein [Gammaproteobacteria bacterium]